MIAAEPAKSFGIMGAAVKQTAERFEGSQKYLRWQDRAANQKSFAGEHLLVLMIAVTVGKTRRDLVEAAYTLGASDGHLIRRVLIPGAAPEIAETLRMVLGWAWTCVIVAELIGASSGIGHMITDSQALLATDQIIFGIIVIGLIGLASDLAFKWANRSFFPWAQLGR